jgi:hypothetical protein
MLEPFSEIRALGAARLREICDDWCRGPVASEFGVVRINVSSDCFRLDPVLQLSASDYDRGDEVHFPFDRVVGYIIDHGSPEAEKDILRVRLPELRKKCGPRVFKRYLVTLDSFRMATRCPSCSHGFLSQHRIFRGQPFDIDPIEPLACSRYDHMLTPLSSESFPVIDRF